MTAAEFVTRAMALPGIPWVRWASGWDGADCFGMVTLWFREVLGIDLGPVPQTDIAAGFADAPGWRECGREAGASCFMAWRAGAPTHCGIVLDDGRLLHSEGCVETGGSVRISRIAAVARVHGDLRFYRYSPPC